MVIFPANRIHGVICRMNEQTQRISIGFLTEGTYPFLGGGVSTWSQLLISGLSQVDFYILAATARPEASLRYPLPSNVKGLTQIAFWGLESNETGEQHRDIPELISQKRKTTEKIIDKLFLPHFRYFVRRLLQSHIDGDWDELGDALVGMALFLRDYNYGVTLHSLPVWNTFLEEILTAFPDDAPQSALASPSIYDAKFSLQLLTALLRPLSIFPPRVQLFHATITSTVTLIGIVEKIRRNTPLLLTEHGIYLRERSIDIGANHVFSYFQKYLLIRLSEIVSRLSYHYADLITPVCHFNGKWETYLGADDHKIRVIYNAIDTDRFIPRPKPPEYENAPTVVMVANVTPVKDVMTLIRAAQLVRDEIPDVKFMVYGSLSADKAYAEACQSLIQGLSLSDVVTLAGRHPHPELVFPAGDISVLTSISEAFPFTVLESMSCARPVVATDVGGVAEALGDAGIIVPPRSPERVAEAIIRLLKDVSLRLALGQRSRERVLSYFQIKHLLNGYQDVYNELRSISQTS